MIGLERNNYKYESGDRQGSLKKPTHECRAIHAQKAVCVCRCRGFNRKTNMWGSKIHMYNFFLYLDFIYMYMKRNTFVCALKNTSVDPEIQVWILLCACVYYEPICITCLQVNSVACASPWRRAHLSQRKSSTWSAYFRTAERALGWRLLSHSFSLQNFWCLSVKHFLLSKPKCKHLLVPLIEKGQLWVKPGAVRELYVKIVILLFCSVQQMSCQWQCEI